MPILKKNEIKGLYLDLCRSTTDTQQSEEEKVWENFNTKNVKDKELLARKVKKKNRKLHKIKEGTL